MATAVLSLRVDAALQKRLADLAAATGKSQAYHVNEALQQHLGAIEYAYTIQREAQQCREDKTGLARLSTVAKNLGLD